MCPVDTRRATQQLPAPAQHARHTTGHAHKTPIHSCLLLGNKERPLSNKGGAAGATSAPVGADAAQQLLQRAAGIEHRRSWGNKRTGRRRGRHGRGSAVACCGVGSPRLGHRCRSVRPPAAPGCHCLRSCCCRPPSSRRRRRRRRPPPWRRPRGCAARRCRRRWSAPAACCRSRPGAAARRPSCRESSTGSCTRATQHVMQHGRGLRTWASVP